MEEFDLYFANNNPNGLEIRDKPFPDFMTKYFDSSNSTYCEFSSASSLYKKIASYISQNCDRGNSYRISKKPNVSEATKLLKKFAKLAFAQENESKEAEEKSDNTKDATVTTEKKDNKDKKDKKKDGDDSDDEEEDATNTTLGLGIYTIKYKDDNIIALHQSIGEPSGRQMNFHFSLLLIIPNKGEIKKLKRFVSMIITDSDKEKDKSIFFQVYRWDSQQQWWRHCGKKIGRKLKTIVLPTETKDRVIGDMERFLSVESIKWYFEHGIPYKRSYLFYGVPGSGKTSLIQCLACKFGKKLCFLQPTSPTMTDDAFRACIQQAPENSIIVLEDIDALFEKDRTKKHQQCPLTFSGLLNGLDGVCNPAGQIFILTTNFVDQLDAALIRSGRVDVHVKFPLATDEQLSEMFSLFYPKAKEESSKIFVDKIRECFPKGISMATTQQHFITNMMATEDELINALTELGSRLIAIDELNEKSKTKAEKEKEKKEKEEKEKKEKEEKEKEEKENKDKEKEKDGDDSKEDDKEQDKNDTKDKSDDSKKKDSNSASNSDKEVDGKTDSSDSGLVIVG